MKFIDLMDPFLIQLIIVPIIVIGLGVLVAYVAKKTFIGPLTTLFLNILYEILYIMHYYPKSEITLSSWNIIFPLISLIFSFIVVANRRQDYT